MASRVFSAEKASKRYSIAVASSWRRRTLRLGRSWIECLLRGRRYQHLKFFPVNQARLNQKWPGKALP